MHANYYFGTKHLGWGGEWGSIPSCFISPVFRSGTGDWMPCRFFCICPGNAVILL